MKQEILQYTSPIDGQSIFATLSTPTDSSKGLVIVFHGLAEHRHRYTLVVSALLEASFAVCTLDHRGHGDSYFDQEIAGYFADKDGWQTNLKDLHAIANLAKEKVGSVPVLVLGHSMGALFACSYVKRYEDEISGVYLSGIPAYLPVVKVAKVIAKVVCALGAKKPSQLLDNMSFGAYNKGIKDAKTRFDWLSIDQTNVQNYIEDPKCGFVSTAGGFVDLLSGISDVYEKNDWAIKKPHLPIQMVSGQNDPAGNPPNGIPKVKEHLNKIGYQNVQLTIYPDVRHEILLDISKEQVIADFVSWCQNTIR